MIGRIRAQRLRRALSFVAVAAAVEVFALQVAAGVVDVGDFDAEPVDAPADPPPTTAGRLTLQVKSGQEGMRLEGFLFLLKTLEAALQDVSVPVCA